MVMAPSTYLSPSLFLPPSLAADSSSLNSLPTVSFPSRIYLFCPIARLSTMQWPSPVHRYRTPSRSCIITTVPLSLSPLFLLPSPFSLLLTRHCLLPLHLPPPVYSILCVRRAPHAFPLPSPSPHLTSLYLTSLTSPTPYAIRTYRRISTHACAHGRFPGPPFCLSLLALLSPPAHIASSYTYSTHYLPLVRTHPRACNAS
ncbi:hypothetical protein C8Q73DRAFT_17586 [Cubamyces lactineus]|nr:hypothetical protein C8Q73DRAFT_17586 [Cubamyces lactineus]